MEYMLRRNVILRDWRDGIDKYYWQHGIRPDFVEMSRGTLIIFAKYVYKSGLLLEYRPETIEAYDRNNNVVSTFNRGYYVYYEGIRILVNNNIEDERMRIIW